MPDGRLLAIYLNDHLGGATGGVELAKRALRSNRGSDLGTFLEGLVAELEEDRQALRSVLAQLGIRESRAKPVLGLVAERLGRLKLNGQLRGYSPLSRVLELEGLTMGIEAKASLWRNLRETPVAERLREIDLDELLARAARQQAGLEPHRVEAARRAFSRQPS